MTKKTKILYVDDEKINIMLFEVNHKKDYNVLTAESGMQGIDTLNSNPDIEFIISDLKMPEMNGLEFIHKVKEINNKIPCMILSGYHQTTEIYEALNSGIIVDYVIKPAKSEQLNELILKHTQS